MLTVRKIQWNVLANNLSETWKNDLCNLLLRAYPEQAKGLSEDDVKNRILYGIKKAKGNGFKFRSNIERFIHLMFLLGSAAFDSPEENSSAANILNWQWVDETGKMDALEKWAQKVVIAELQKKRASG